MDPKLKAKFDEYIGYERDQSILAEMARLAENRSYDKLSELLLSRMTFGTAGLRARMGPGYIHMNDLTIIQTSQGLLEYAKRQFTDLANSGIMIGYDARRNSKRWAMLVANIFANAGVRVYFSNDFLPTPLVAFGVRFFKAALGVVITASHNPKDDNGYKVYFSNGAQIISPHDKGISDSILDNLVPLDSSWCLDGFDEKPSIIALQDDFFVEYLKVLEPYQTKSINSKYNFVYTPMHGVGGKFVLAAVKKFGPYNLHVVPEQFDPNGDFPTVKYPNPEEGKSALDLAIAKADSINSRLILANDPDADRLAVAERQPSGHWKIFTGNELGALFGWWIWKKWRSDNPDGDASKVGMISSTVSSKILQTIAEKEGFYFEETLTGFKWMGNRAHALSSKLKILFAFEEAIGFMTNDYVLDKDGISALILMCELATHAYDQNSSVQHQLEKIYCEYGEHLSNNGYYFSHDQVKIDAMFHRLRNWPTNPSEAGYPTHLGPFRITGVRDLTVGYDDSSFDKKPSLPVSKSSHCITFTFDTGVSLTLRTSGTEPKIKYYSEMRSQPGAKFTRSQLAEELQNLIDLMIDQFYQPQINGFIAQSV